MMKLLPIALLLVAMSLWAQTTFEYLPGYPQGCSDRGPASQYVNGSYNFGDQASCQIPDLKPPGNFTPPAIGGTYTDPNFGYTVRVSTPGGYYHTYSTPSPLSATGKYLAVQGNDQNGTIGGRTAIFDPKTGAIVKADAGASQDWGFWWHPTDDDVYFAINGSNIVRRSVTQTGSTVVLDLAAKGLQFLHKGTGDVAPDLWLAFGAGPLGGNIDRACAAPLDGSGKLYCLAFSSFGLNNFDFAIVAKGIDSVTGKRYVLAEQAGGAILSVDTPNNALKLEYRVPNVHWNHCDMVQGPDGRQYIFGLLSGDPPKPADANGNTYGGDLLALWPLSEHDPVKQQKFTEQGGSARKILRMSWWSPVIAGPGRITHYNCAKNAAVCTLGTRNIEMGLTDNAPQQQPFGLEVLTVEIKASGFVVKRLAKVRSIGYNTNLDGSNNVSDYDAFAFCALSADASVVACHSNFGGPPAVPHSVERQRNMREITIATGINAPPAPAPPKIVWKLTGGNLPDGLTLAPDGTISGTATGPPGIYTFQVEASISDGSAAPTRSTHVITVTEPPAPPTPEPPPVPQPKITITSPTDLGQVEQGQAFSYRLTAAIA